MNFFQDSFSLGLLANCQIPNIPARLIVTGKEIYFTNVWLPSRFISPMGRVMPRCQWPLAPDSSQSLYLALKSTNKEEQKKRGERERESLSERHRETQSETLRDRERDRRESESESERGGAASARVRDRETLSERERTSAERATDLISRIICNQVRSVGR